MFEENSFVYTFVANVILSGLVYYPFVNKLWYVNAEITVDCELCQHSPDSYISFNSIIHPIHPIRFD